MAQRRQPGRPAGRHRRTLVARAAAWRRARRRRQPHGGIAGHAGIFSTAAEVAVIGELLLGGGVHDGTRILSEEITRQMLTNVNVGLPAVDPERPNRTSAHGLGVVLDQPWFMGRLSSPRTFGHTGFTGTSLVVHPDRQMVLVLLTNRAHPNWSWANPDPVRTDVADAVAVIPPRGRDNPHAR
ncbi:serine hydrolase domain-containing protein [Micromonospora sp. CPCC 205561]|uniref:serine hydrolase domain-containing protein n=1 Tax=Micromonospora sp. CPCC 205561 TaxID=3122407 RepID=UPI002FF25ABD